MRINLLLFLFIATFICACEKEPPSDDTSKFGHDSPRPECLYSVEPGRVAYYEKPVVVMAGWSEPGAAVNLGEPVNSIYLDGEHALSPDGTQLFLTSDRPGGLGGQDIWISAKTGGNWSTPVNPDTPLNSESSEGQPGFAANKPNTIYFVHVLIDNDGVFGSNI